MIELKGNHQIMPEQNALGAIIVSWLEGLTDKRNAMEFLLSHKITAYQIAEALSKEGEVKVIGVFGTSDFHKMLDVERLANGGSCFPKVDEIITYKYKLCEGKNSVMEKVECLPDLDLVPIVEGGVKIPQLERALQKEFGDNNYTYYLLFQQVERILQNFPYTLPLDIGVVTFSDFLSAFGNLDTNDPRFFRTPNCILVRDGKTKESKRKPIFLNAHLIAHAIPLWWDKRELDLYRKYRQVLLDYYKEIPMEKFWLEALMNENWKKSYPRLHNDPAMMRSLYTRWESGRSGNIPSLIE